jgi:excisionase family DNA binding protein
MKISIGKAAEELGVSRETLRRWEKSGKIIAERTPKGHRRYDLACFRGLAPRKKLEEKRTIAYARVLSQDLRR